MEKSVCGHFYFDAFLWINFLLLSSPTALDLYINNTIYYRIRTQSFKTEIVIILNHQQSRPFCMESDKVRELNKIYDRINLRFDFLFIFCFRKMEKCTRTKRDGMELRSDTYRIPTERGNKIYVKYWIVRHEVCSMSCWPSKITPRQPLKWTRKYLITMSDDDHPTDSKLFQIFFRTHIRTYTNCTRLKWDVNA